MAQGGPFDLGVPRKLAKIPNPMVCIDYLKNKVKLVETWGFNTTREDNWDPDEICKDCKYRLNRAVGGDCTVLSRMSWFWSKVGDSKNV